MSFRPREHLRHILDEAEFLSSSKAGGWTPGFGRNEMARRAFARSFEIAGEAKKKIPADFRETHRAVELAPMARTDIAMIHGSLNVDVLALPGNHSGEDSEAQGTDQLNS